MKFFSSLYHSLFDVEWLRQRRGVSGKAWGYFFGFIALVSFVGLIAAAIYVPYGIRESKNFITQYIPERFEARITSGTLAIAGIDQPYIFTDDSKEQFIVIVDTVTTSPLSIKDYLQHASQSGVLVDKHKVEFHDARSARAQTQYWTDIPNTSIDRAAILSFIDRIGPAVIAIGLLILLVVVFIALVVSALFDILIVSVIVLIVSSIARRGWQFGELFTVGLHAITVPLVLSFLFQIFGVTLPHIQFLALLAFMLAVLFTRSSKVPTQDTVKEDPASQS